MHILVAIEASISLISIFYRYYNRLAHKQQVGNTVSILKIPSTCNIKGVCTKKHGHFLALQERYFDMN